MVFAGEPSRNDGAVENQFLGNWLPNPLSDPFSLETFGVDMSDSMRDVLGITGDELQARLIMTGNQAMAVNDLWFSNSASNSIFPQVDQAGSSRDGTIRIKYNRAHGRTAYIPGMTKTITDQQLMSQVLSRSPSGSSSTLLVRVNPNHRPTLSRRVDVFPGKKSTHSGIW